MSSPSPAEPPQPLPTYLKFLTDDGKSPFRGFKWPIDEWVKAEGPLRLCGNGIHVCTIEHAIRWLSARCHPVEIRGEQLAGDDKLCVREARLGPALAMWNERAARLFAADCAEHVLPIFEREHPDDERPRIAIAVARRFAVGDATQDELAAAWAAARAAAWDAAWDAAGDAAGAAERHWQSDHLAKILSGELYSEDSSNG